MCVCVIKSNFPNPNDGFIFHIVFSFIRFIFVFVFFGGVFNTYSWVLDILLIFDVYAAETMRKKERKKEKKTNVDLKQSTDANRKCISFLCLSYRRRNMNNTRAHIDARAQQLLKPKHKYDCTISTDNKVLFN